VRTQAPVQAPVGSAHARAGSTLRRSALAGTLLLGAAALADRLGGPVTPFLIMAAALVPQTLALGLALYLPNRISWLKVHLPTTWFLRVIAGLCLVAALVGLVGASAFWLASLAAGFALLIAAWSPVVVAFRE
jgi:hypothetical protein